MKKSLIAVAVLGAFSSVAFAQTNVTIYGKIDETVHNLSNQYNSTTKASSTVTKLDAGALSGNRWGLKGTEDLGNGLKTVFQLESGYDLNVGTMNQGGRLFGRQAYVGLSGDFGQVTFGRQYDVAFQTIGKYDPLGWGNWTADSWHADFAGLRTDNSIEYTLSSSGFGVVAQYAPGGVAGNNSAGRTAGLGLSYTGMGLTVAAGSQSSYDTAYTTTVAPRKATLTTVGATYAIAAFTVYVDYVNSKKDAAFGTTPGAAPSSITSNANATAQRTDKFYTVGAAYQITPASAFTLAWMNDKITNVTDTKDGKQSTIYALYDYNLSKRTDVYGIFTSSKVSDGAVVGSSTGANNDIAIGSGQTKQNEFGIGLRHVF